MASAHSSVESSVVSTPDPSSEESSDSSFQSSEGKNESELTVVEAFADLNTAQEPPVSEEKKKEVINWFEKLLSLWVAISVVGGSVIGYYWPALGNSLSQASIAQIWIPGAVLVWLMVYPMMLKIEWTVLKELPRHPGGLILTTVMNWAVQPFVMYGFALLFFRVVFSFMLTKQQQDEYLAGAVLLGGSPCTAMVFVWSSMAKGNATYTLVQVCVNDLLLFALYIPTVALLLGISGLSLPWDTVILSTVVFVVIPFVLGIITRILLLKCKPKKITIPLLEKIFKPISAIALLLVVFFTFALQGPALVRNWLHILVIAVPLTLQTAAAFGMTYASAYALCLPHDIAAPAAFIGSSNFFELAIALAISIYGPMSGAVLVTIVGVFTEVPLMLLEVLVVNKTRKNFKIQSLNQDCFCHKIHCKKND